MYELTRAIPRDILENGGGKGTVGAASALSRSAALLAMRIKYNSYPIYVVEGDRMRLVITLAVVQSDDLHIILHCNNHFPSFLLSFPQ